MVFLIGKTMEKIMGRNPSPHPFLILYFMGFFLKLIALESFCISILNPPNVALFGEVVYFCCI
jgi:hypothetical protein